MITKPKPRIKEVFKKTLENGGNVSKAMRDLKYKETTINNPKNVTETKSWETLLGDVSDEKLLRVLDEGLEATQVKTSLTEPDRTLPDFAVRHRYLETGFKLKGRLIEKKDINLKGSNVIVLPEQELNERREKILDSSSRATNGSIKEE